MTRITTQDVERYLSKETRGSGYGTTRSPKEIEEDFKVLHALRLQGHTFDESTEYLNNVRPYITTPEANKKLYFRKLDSMEMFKDNEEAIRFQRSKTLDMLDWIVAECVKAWRASFENNEIVERSGYVKKQGEGDLEDLDDMSYDEQEAMLQQYEKKYAGKDTFDGKGDLDNALIPLKNEFMRITKNPKNTESGRFLNMILTAEQFRAKLLGLVKEKAGNVDILNVIQNITIVDDGGNSTVTPITSEMEAIRQFDESQIMYTIDDSPLVKEDDDEEFLNVDYAEEI